MDENDLDKLAFVKATTPEFEPRKFDRRHIDIASEAIVIELEDYLRWKMTPDVERVMQARADRVVHALSQIGWYLPIVRVNFNMLQRHAHIEWLVGSRPLNYETDVEQPR